MADFERGNGLASAVGRERIELAGAAPCAVATDNFLPDDSPSDIALRTDAVPQLPPEGTPKTAEREEAEPPRRISRVSLKNAEYLRLLGGAK